jgi:hypothetical protein
MVQYRLYLIAGVFLVPCKYNRMDDKKYVIYLLIVVLSSYVLLQSWCIAISLLFLVTAAVTFNPAIITGIHYFIPNTNFSFSSLSSSRVLLLSSSPFYIHVCILPFYLPIFLIINCSFVFFNISPFLTPLPAR